MNNISNEQLAAALLRVSLGLMYIAHGLLKVVVFTLPGTAAFFGSVGLPGWLAYPVTIGEIVGGALLVAGIGARTISLAFLPILLGAFYVHWDNGWLFTNQNGGWEYVAFLIVVSVAVALLGNGAFAAQSKLRAQLQTNEVAPVGRQ